MTSVQFTILPREINANQGHPNSSGTNSRMRSGFDSVFWCVQKVQANIENVKRLYKGITSDMSNLHLGFSHTAITSEHTSIGSYLGLLQFIKFDPNGSKLTIEVRVKMRQLANLFVIIKSVLSHHSSKPNHLILIVREPRPIRRLSIAQVMASHGVGRSRRVEPIKRFFCPSEIVDALAEIKKLKDCCEESVQVKGWEDNETITAELERQGHAFSQYKHGTSKYLSVTF